MKNRLLISFLIIFPYFINAQNLDTSISKVYVGFRYHQKIFPDSWRDAPIHATGRQMNPAEIPRCKAITNKALGKYSEELLGYNLKYLYFLREMKFYDVGFGGTNSNDAIYLTNQGVAAGYTDRYLEQTFHHEFSSILFRNYSRFIDTSEWKEANAAGFAYNDPESGVGAIRNNQSSQALDTLLCKKGLLTQYATSGLENDINTIAQNLFLPEKEFWNYVDRFPAIRKKVDLLIHFYSKLSPFYTEAYFRKFENQ